MKETETAGTPVNFEVLKQTAMQANSKKNEIQEQYDKARKVLEAKIEMLTKAWNMSNAELIESRNEADKAFTDVDAEIRSLAVAQFKETGDKQIGFGISVRVDTKYQYDENEAIKYAIDHDMPHMLKIDGPKFKKFASITPLTFVETKPSATAVISYTDK